MIRSIVWRSSIRGAKLDWTEITWSTDTLAPGKLSALERRESDELLVRQGFRLHFPKTHEEQMMFWSFRSKKRQGK